MKCFEQREVEKFIIKKREENKEKNMMAFYRGMDSNTRKMILKTLDGMEKRDGKLTGNNKILQKVLRKLE